MYAHQAPFRPVHDRLPYSPIVDRVPLAWPEDARVAVWIVPNIEHYELLPPPGPSDPYPRTPHPDVRKYGYHDYGNRVALWRLLEVFDDLEIPCTASLNVAVLDHYPDVMAAMLERGWDLMSHGLYNTRFVTGMSEAEERQFFTHCNEVLQRHVGRDFDGLLGPFITANSRTPDLMSEFGMRYHADWVHDDRPSPLLNSSGHRMVALPYTYELNDGPLLRSHVEGEDYAQRCVDQFDTLYREGAEGGRMMCLALHPFGIGQPHRISHLRRVLQHMRDHDAVWFATGGQIVDHYLDRAYDEDLVRATGGVG